MKKILKRTTAIVATGLFVSPVIVSDASAADKIKLGLGGFMNQWVGVSENDSKYNNAQAGLPNVGGFDVMSDSEIYVSGSTKLDNGLTVAVKTELESDTGGTTNSDEASVTVSSATLGTITLGADDSMASDMHNTAPDVGMGLDDGDFGLWITIPAADTAPVATDSNPGADAMGISYLSPSFSGVSVGLTYKPDTTDESANTAQTNPNDGWTASMAYSGTVGDVTVGADIFHGVLNDSAAAGTQTAGYDETGVGVSVGFGGFTFAGAYKAIDQAEFAGTSSLDGKVWTVGGSYAAGAASVSLGWLHGESVGDVSTAGNDEKDIIQLSGAYDLGGGVALAGSAFRAEYDDEAAAAGSNNEGWAVVGGLNISF